MISNLIAVPSPVPYEILLVFCLVVTLACFALVSFLRQYRRKRNLLIYSVLILIFGLLIYQSYDLSIGPSWFIYNLEDSGKQFHAGQINTFSVFCKNVGMRTASGTLVIASVNATFTAYSQQTYPGSNSTTIRIPFSFQPRSQDTKLVQFTINEKVAGFAFFSYVESSSNEYWHLRAFYGLETDGVWSNLTNSYTLHTLPTPCA